MRTETKLVTPDLAAEWLERNVENRVIRQSRVAELATAMRQEQWVLTHQGIAFGVSGRLLDGQHRLWAVLMAGVPVRMMVTWDMPDETFTALDIGAKRTLADAMRIDRGDIAVANVFIQSIAKSIVTAPAELVGSVMSIFAPELLDIRRNPHDSAQVRAGFVLRAASDPATREEVVDEFRLFCGRSQDMRPQVYALARAIDDKRLNLSSGRLAFFWRTWAALDPARRDMPKLTALTADAALAEIRGVYQTRYSSMFTEVSQFVTEVSQLRYAAKTKRLSMNPGKPADIIVHAPARPKERRAS